MIDRRSFSVIVGILFLIGLMYGELSAQDAVREKVMVKGREVEKIVNSKGWAMPPLGKIDTIESKTFDNDGLPVTLTERTFYDSPLFARTSFAMVPDGSLRLSVDTFKVRSMIIFKSGEREFARRIDSNPVLGGEGRDETVPFIVSDLFVDEDGDGNFEVRYNKIGGGLIPSYAVPDWVRKTR